MFRNTRAPGLLENCGDRAQLSEKWLAWWRCGMHAIQLAHGTAQGAAPREAHGRNISGPDGRVLQRKM